LAVSAIVAVNPHQADAASTTESLVVKAEQNKVVLSRAISVEYNADAKNSHGQNITKLKRIMQPQKQLLANYQKKIEIA
jgi:hypothetical protein